jgi:hypothetical protein
MGKVYIGRNCRNYWKTFVSHVGKLNILYKTRSSLRHDSDDVEDMTLTTRPLSSWLDRDSSIHWLDLLQHSTYDVNDIRCRCAVILSFKLNKAFFNCDSVYILINLHHFRMCRKFIICI